MLGRQKDMLLAGVVPVLAGCLLCAAAETAPLGQLDPPPDAVVVPALAKNIFFPSARSGALGPGPTSRRAEESQFVLAGVVVAGELKKALLEFPATGRLEWVTVGDGVGDVMVADVSEQGVTFKLGPDDLLLAVGRPEADLYGGRQVLHGGFEVVGVCRAPSHQFALVRLDDSDQVQRVGLRDRLDAGEIVEIAEDGIILRAGGATQMVSVGKRFAGGAVR